MEKIFKSTEPTVGRAVTIGTFDGVHRGHELVIDTLKLEAEARGLEPVVITFDRHPLELIAPEEAPKMIISRSERNNLIRSRGVEVCELEFNEELRGITAAEWMRKLAEEFGVRLLVTGYDSTFGSDAAELSPRAIMVLAEQLNIEVVRVKKVRMCSSTEIRKCLLEDDLKNVERVLGRPFTIKGTVIHGRGVGKDIGFPTANLQTEDSQLLPPDGVYVSEVFIADQPTPWRAVTNIGTSPTVDGSGKHTIETHLIGIKRELYDTPLAVSILKRIRSERKFDTLLELKRAIEKDIKYARAFKSPSTYLPVSLRNKKLKKRGRKPKQEGKNFK